MPGVISGNFGMGAQGVLTDTPTITYAPLAGERFARSMMMPMPVFAILNVLQGGYPVEYVFSCRSAVSERCGQPPCSATSRPAGQSGVLRPHQGI